MSGHRGTVAKMMIIVTVMGIQIPSIQYRYPVQQKTEIYLGIPKLVHRH